MTGKNRRGKEKKRDLSSPPAFSMGGGVVLGVTTNLQSIKEEKKGRRTISPDAPFRRRKREKGGKSASHWGGCWVGVWAPRKKTEVVQSGASKLRESAKRSLPRSRTSKKTPKIITGMQRWLNEMVLGDALEQESFRAAKTFFGAGIKLETGVTKKTPSPLHNA